MKFLERPLLLFEKELGKGNIIDPCKVINTVFLRLC